MKKLPAVGSAIVVLLLMQPVWALAAKPQEQVRETIDKVLAIIKDPRLKENKNERRNKLVEVIRPRFDFAEMAKRSLGPHWQRRNPEERKQFTELFTNLLEDAYIDKIASYNGEKVQYVREKQDDGTAEVDTKIIDKKGQEFALNYRLHNVDGDWKVYDVVIEDISLVNNYRAQFNHVLAKSSFQDLLARMKQKNFSRV